MPVNSKRAIYNFAARIRFSYIFIIIKFIKNLEWSFTNKFSTNLINLFDPNNIRKRTNWRIRQCIVIHTTPGGDFFELDLSDHVDYRTYIYNYFDNTVLQFIKNYSLADSTIFIDVGANIGSITIPIANLDVETIAIEPSTINFDKLLKNGSLNTGVFTLIKEAMVGHSFMDKQLLIYSPFGNFGASSYNSGWNPGESLLHTEVVATNTLDDLFFSLKINTLGKKLVIKIDVEGMEDEVLDGADKVIKEIRPYIILEWRMDRYEDKSKDKLLNKIEGLINYNIFAIRSDNDKIVLDKFDKSSNYENIVLIPGKI